MTNFFISVSGKFFDRYIVASKLVRFYVFYFGSKLEKHRLVNNLWISESSSYLTVYKILSTSLTCQVGNKMFMLWS